MLKLLSSNILEKLSIRFSVANLLPLSPVVSLLFATKIDVFTETERIFVPDFAFTTLTYL